ncbi:MAG: protein phosphatase 2C domain-containing protein, partial [Pseudomonadota bacterium]|nr:protein phosphatase 2C domain-containing protein [Pseudomonadota bacterium]
MSSLEQRLLEQIIAGHVAGDAGPERVAAFAASDPAQAAARRFLDELAAAWQRHPPPAEQAAQTVPLESLSALNPHRRPGEVRAGEPRRHIDDPPPRVRFSLANGSVGKDYRAALDIDAGGGHVEVRDLELPDGLGLGFDAATLTVQGVPQIPGDHPLRVRFAIRGPSDTVREQTLVLTINPDPRSLWKSLDPDASAPYYKKPSDHRTLDAADGRRLAGASQRGRSHANRGEFRDDDLALTHDPASGWDLLAVADGAGSSELARRGSQLAVGRSLEALGELLAGAP